MAFADREEAGGRLGARLRELAVRADCVLGLPRGGVVVAASVARQLERPLGVLVVRKLGHPRYREFAVGALAEPDVVVLDQASLAQAHVRPEELATVIAEETQRLRDYQARFESGPLPRWDGQRVMLCDDGLATGATMEAAARSARGRGAAAVLVAVPVASESGLQRIERVADRVIALLVDAKFDAVGWYYDDFPQTADEEVLALLAHAGGES